jgi:hypothetical protein
MIKWKEGGRSSFLRRGREGRGYNGGGEKEYLFVCVFVWGREGEEEEEERNNE